MMVSGWNYLWYWPRVQTVIQSVSRILIIDELIKHPVQWSEFLFLEPLKSTFLIDFISCMNL
jgi:hypothetical protein